MENSDNDLAIVVRSSTLQKELTLEEKEKLENSTPISDFRRKKLLEDAKKNWDRFYHRNSDNFFKDRNWTKRELEFLCGDDLKLKV